MNIIQQRGYTDTSSNILHLVEFWLWTDCGTSLGSIGYCSKQLLSLVKQISLTLTNSVSPKTINDVTCTNQPIIDWSGVRWDTRNIPIPLTSSNGHFEKSTNPFVGQSTNDLQQNLQASWTNKVMKIEAFQHINRKHTDEGTYNNQNICSHKPQKDTTSKPFSQHSTENGLFRQMFEIILGSRRKMAKFSPLSS